MKKRVEIIFKNCCAVSSIFILLLLSCGCKQKPVSLKIGEPLPKVAISDMSGKKLNLPGDFSGSVVVVRFWADWCRSCEIEMPVLDSLYKKYGNKKFVVLAINAGQPKEAVEAFAQKLNLSYPVLLDPGSAIAKQYGVVGLPTTFIIDREGRLMQKILGETGGDILENILLKIL